MDRLWVYTSVRDEEHLMPFFLRHYQSIADKVFVQDCGSKDRTAEIVQSSSACFIPTGDWGMDEKRRRDESHEFVNSAKGQTKWCIAVDADEFVLGDFDRAFADADRCGADVLHTTGWTMTGDGFPVDDGRQIYEIRTQGIRGGADKPCICRAGAQFLWSVGRHFIETQETRVMCPILHLLHFRYMGYAYTKARNDRNWANSPNKLTAHTCSPGYTGAHSAHSAGEGVNHGGNVMEVISKEGYNECSAYAPHLDGSRMIKA